VLKINKNSFTFKNMWERHSLGSWRLCQRPMNCKWKNMFLCQMTQFHRLLETAFNRILYLRSQCYTLSEGLSSFVDAIIQQNNLICHRLSYPQWFFQPSLQDLDVNHTNNNQHLKYRLAEQGWLYDTSPWA